jgi:hypothetical protein
MRAFQASTGLGPQLLLRRRALPPGLNAAIVSGWMCGNIKSARPEHIEFVLSLWAKIERSGAGGRVSLTDEDRANLKRLIEEARINLKVFFRRAEGIPRKLTYVTVMKWLTGEIVTVEKDHFDFLMERLEALRAG